MVARIFRPSRTAMQSGKNNTKEWLLEYEPSAPKKVEPLMGYTSSRDPNQQIRLSFESREQAVRYATENDIPYRIEEEKVSVRPKVSYSDNFRYDRRQPWTH